MLMEEIPYDLQRLPSVRPVFGGCGKVERVEKHLMQ